MFLLLSSRLSLLPVLLHLWHWWVWMYCLLLSSFGEDETGWVEMRWDDVRMKEGLMKKGSDWRSDADAMLMWCPYRPQAIASIHQITKLHISAQIDVHINHMTSHKGRAARNKFTTGTVQFRWEYVIQNPNYGKERHDRGSWHPNSIHPSAIIPFHSSNETIILRNRGLGV